MTTNIRNWGNSQGLYIPKKLLKEANLEVNDSVSINVENDAIVIRKDTSSEKRQEAWKSIQMIRNTLRNKESISSNDYRDERNEYLDEKYGTR